MDEQNKNLILATALSFAVILVWFLLFPPPEREPVDTIAPAAATEGTAPAVATAPAAAPGTAAATADAAAPNAAADAPRVQIDATRLSGSISLVGGRIDDLKLKDYHVTIDDQSPIVEVLTPVGSEQAYYALYGWAPGAGVDPADVPGANTPWQLEQGDTLTTEKPVVLRWQSPSGLVYRRTIAVDGDYMFTVTQSVQNTTAAPIALAPYGIVARHGEPADRKKFFVLHEGIVGMADGKLTEIDYSDMPDMELVESEGAQAEVTQVSQDGWIGFTDHYWMTTLVPAPGTPFKSVAKYDAARDIYQAEAVMRTLTVEPGQTAESSSQIYSGAKEWETIKQYQDAGVDRFDDSIDWGWFFFLTKPIFRALHWLHGMIGNMGIAIILLTFLIKAILFPLAFKSYVSMARMKELQPEMQSIKERAGDDKAKMQQEMMALYKKEKVNPASGCLPILLQIPIFFSLYKVIFVTLELRHAPWVGWIRDLSAPDPSSILNLFGLLPFDAPGPGSMLALISLGVLPILLGISMWLQQKLNPAPTDPTQKMIFAWMPWVFMFMLGSFASGLVLYWIANNTITFIQQYTIMRIHGYKPDVFGNIRSGFARRTGGGDGAAKK